MSVSRLMQMAQAGVPADDMIVEYVSSYFIPYFSGTSFSQSVDTGTNTYAGYTRYVLCAHGNLNAFGTTIWSGNTPTLGGTSTTVIANLISSTSYLFGYVWSIQETATTGSQTYALTLNSNSAGAGIFVFNVFVKGGVPTLHDSDTATGSDGGISLSVPEGLNVVLMAAIPQNDSISIGGTVGITDSGKVASGDVNSGEIATAAFKEDVASGTKTITTSGGQGVSVVTGITLKLT